MSTVSTIIRLVAKSVAGLVVLAILVYLSLLLVNLNDAGPTDLTQQFRNSYASHPIPADSDNAFLTILGFSALPDDDPLTMGIARRDWMMSDDWKSGKTDDPLLMDYEPRADRPEAVTELAEACKDPGHGLALLEHRARHLCGGRHNSQRRAENTGSLQKNDSFRSGHCPCHHRSTSTPGSVIWPHQVHC